MNQKHEWTPYWSGRGIAMMNTMEYKSGSNSSTAYTNHLSFAKKLDALISAYPYDKLYKDLRNQMKHGKSLSTKQLQVIEVNFNQKINN
ncbi:hypothetical protein A4H97_33740 [Niastella yeongjuensis]|uniref:Uncharacterized protein n=1 Tax=Niastella yeongjuensis TaxID=354355 RepID=A0A1V9EDD8_9BACT|nr:hypothetical protein A4H97_33740 [Niastella yeongjuensis]SEP49239.1 hypothetical protein SAMN05660816_06929 [Niastella yeongjuensis]